MQRLHNNNEDDVDDREHRLGDYESEDDENQSDAKGFDLNLDPNYYELLKS